MQAELKALIEQDDSTATINIQTQPPEVQVEASDGEVARVPLSDDLTLDVD